MGKKSYCITEFGYLYTKKNIDISINGIQIPDDIFNILENNVIQDKSNYSEIFVMKHKKGFGKVLQAQNWVGIIETKNKDVIEILPKIYNAQKLYSKKETQDIFIKMIKTLKDMPFKNIGFSNLQSQQMNLFEIFIKMFLVELDVLFKKGLKSGYVGVVENNPVFKGKLLVKQQVTKNFIHKERFFTKYNLFNMNIPQNRIIKATLDFLKTRTDNHVLLSLINKYIFILDEVALPKNITQDIERCSDNRIMIEYKLIIQWCEIFLNKKSLISATGNNLSLALLFPMEKIFESYVAYHIKKFNLFKDYEISIQDKEFYLIEEPKKFGLRPDIVIKKNNVSYVLDTKWKILSNDSRKNYNISQSDLYQMYAYAKKYGSKDVFLLYPFCNLISDNEDIIFQFEEGIRLHIIFIELDYIENSLYKIYKVLNELI